MKYKVCREFLSGCIQEKGQPKLIGQKTDKTLITGRTGVRNRRV